MSVPIGQCGVDENINVTRTGLPPIWELEGMGAMSNGAKD
jgi:hypothetical protein